MVVCGIPSSVIAGNQKEEALADAVRVALARAALPSAGRPRFGPSKPCHSDHVIKAGRKCE